MLGEKKACFLLSDLPEGFLAQQQPYSVGAVQNYQGIATGSFEDEGGEKAFFIHLPHLRNSQMVWGVKLATLQSQSLPYKP